VKYFCSIFLQVEESWEKIKLWIAERQKFHNINISQAGVNKLIDLIGSNYRYLDNELIKLSNYKLDQIIDDKDVEIMVSGIRESSIFELIDSILEKNIISASKLLDQMISNGQNFFSIQQMLSRQVRLIIMTQNLIQINDPKEIQKKIQVNSSFAFNKILNQSKQFSNKRMKDILKNLLQLDIDIKSGNKTEKEILEKLVYIL
jgi:DNA polymerase III, delta subunit